jgi:phosphatidylglycerophosphate synthase
MTITRAIGVVCDRILLLLVRPLSLSRIHPNVLTFIGLLVNGAAAALLASGRFIAAGIVIMGAGLFDMMDGRVARQTNRVTRFGGFLDSVLDRYSDLVLLMGLLVYYASINRYFYVVLTAVVMTGSVMVSYTRARAECTIDRCRVGFMERPERVVLLIIGAFFDRMAPVLWVIAVLSNVTVISRLIYTWQETRHSDNPQIETRQAAASARPR